MKVTTTTEHGTVRAFIDGYEYASASLPVTATEEEIQKLRKRVAQRALRAYEQERRKYA